MEKKLDQGEIDALFRVTGAGSAPAEAASGSDLEEQPYSFVRGGKFSNEQMKAISAVNDLFARNLMHNLGAWLRTQFQVNLASGEQLPYAEFVERIAVPAYVCSLRLEPLGVLAVMELDLALASPIVDVLLGGVGRGTGAARELTDIEEAILRSVVEIIVRELNLAWAPVGLQFTLEKREMEAQIPRLMAATERTMSVSFEVRMPEAQGVLNLSLPAVVLNVILRKLTGDRDRPRRRSLEAAQRMRELVGQVEVDAVLQFPPMRVSARELAALVPGTVLRLPLPQHASSELRIGGLAYARAHPVQRGEHRGAQLEGAGEMCQQALSQPEALRLVPV